jgi:uncharacterized membrane protein
MDQHTHTSGTGSTAALGGHPLHPMLVGFPITLFIGAFVTDVVYLATSGAFWAQSSFWLLAAGVAMGLLAAIPGRSTCSRSNMRGAGAWPGSMA